MCRDREGSRSEKGRLGGLSFFDAGHPLVHALRAQRSVSDIASGSIVYINPADFDVNMR